MTSLPFRLTVSFSFAASTFVAGFGAFVTLFGWVHMDMPTALSQLLPAALIVGLLAAMVWPGTPMGPKASIYRALLVLAMATPLLVRPAVTQHCSTNDVAEWIGCALGTTYVLAKMFSALAVFSTCMTGFLLSQDSSADLPPPQPQPDESP